MQQNALQAFQDYFQDSSMSHPSSANAPGLLVPGTIINLYNRPQTTPPAGPNGIQQGTVRSLSGKEYGDYKGARSTTYSKSFTLGGREILLPTVVGGKFLTDDAAIARYRKTGEHLGIFDTPEHADAYATALHNNQEAVGNYYGATSTNPSTGNALNAVQ